MAVYNGSILECKLYLVYEDKEEVEKFDKDYFKFTNTLDGFALCEYVKNKGARYFYTDIPYKASDLLIKRPPNTNDSIIIVFDTLTYTAVAALFYSGSLFPIYNNVYKKDIMNSIDFCGRFDEMMSIGYVASRHKLVMENRMKEMTKDINAAFNVFNKISNIL